MAGTKRKYNDGTDGGVRRVKSKITDFFSYEREIWGVYKLENEENPQSNLNFAGRNYNL